MDYNRVNEYGQQAAPAPDAASAGAGVEDMTTRSSQESDTSTDDCEDAPASITDTATTNDSLGKHNKKD